MKGIIALMGSGEMTSTMVEVHKELLTRCGDFARAVFIDTPAGFQLNADQLAEKAVTYFRSRVMHPLTVVSYRSAEGIAPYDAEQAFRQLREANYFLIGPGSPTYAVRQWKHTPIPDIIISRIQDGACLVAASAAALTVGRYTLPVYEIYKVGESLHWIEGSDILGALGLNLVVVPHWNNAEGGNHDTRFCYMGEPRFTALMAQLPADTAVMGLDEHTACLIDLHREVFEVRGLGSVTLLKAGAKRCFEKGSLYPLCHLSTGAMEMADRTPRPHAAAAGEVKASFDDAFWGMIHRLQATCHENIEKGRPEKVVNALLQLDGIIWKAQADLESQESISQAREILRDMIVALGTGLNAYTRSIPAHLLPLVNDLVSLRNSFRRQHKWTEADALRDCLMKAGIIIEDAKEGSQWRYIPP